MTFQKRPASAVHGKCWGVGETLENETTQHPAPSTIPSEANRERQIYGSPSKSVPPPHRTPLTHGNDKCRANPRGPPVSLPKNKTEAGRHTTPTHGQPLDAGRTAVSPTAQKGRAREKRGPGPGAGQRDEDRGGGSILGRLEQRRPRALRHPPGALMEAHPHPLGV
jgi:hypothetical protein